MPRNIAKKLKLFALADAIIEPDWEFRYFSYNSKWSATAEMASLRDGCGGEWFLWLSGELAGFKCLSPNDGVMPDLEKVKRTFPQAYRPFVAEPAFSMEAASCIWYLDGTEWRKFGLSSVSLIDIDDISHWTPSDYHSWASGYYDVDIDIKLIDKLLKGEFSEELAKNLNPKVDMSKLKLDLDEIGIFS